MQPGYEFIEARFIDEDHLNVAVMWKTPEEKLIEQVISSDPTQLQWNQLMEHTTEKAVWDRTETWKLEEKKKFDNYIRPIVDTEVERRVQAEIALREKRVKVEVTKRLGEKYPDLVDELNTKRSEVTDLIRLVKGKEGEIDNLITSVNLKDGEVQILARDNKILVEDIERVNENMKEFVNKPFTVADSEVLEKELAIIKEQLQQEMVVTPEQVFQLLTHNDKNEEYLFKFKLEAFKLDSVKNSKSKKIKTSIRKAKTIAELLSLI
tara:strand:- start:12627 stop:13421 length:795 start_codon:yes stop_codon:yes gene_type:complete